ncbi:MAG: hypothetical protein MJA83_05880, partial [Gammaproteobacteria bacterium]|nr:hypothetical protein [Gammaproteobacteria bacterium]
MLLFQYSAIWLMSVALMTGAGFLSVCAAPGQYVADTRPEWKPKVVYDDGVTVDKRQLEFALEAVLLEYLRVSQLTNDIPRELVGGAFNKLVISFQKEFVAGMLSWHVDCSGVPKTPCHRTRHYVYGYEPHHIARNAGAEGAVMRVVPGDCLATSNLVHETLHFLEDVLAGVTPSTMLDVEHDRRLFMRDDNKK